MFLFSSLVLYFYFVFLSFVQISPGIDVFLFVDGSITHFLPFSRDVLV